MVGLACDGPEPPREKSLHATLKQRKEYAVGLMRTLAAYRDPNAGRSAFELAITLVPFLFLWFLMWVALDAGYWIALLLAVPTAGFLVRLFIIQHDCGHSAFFRWRSTNDWVGRFISVLTLTPYDYWRQSHALHHASSGNLDRRGIGDIETLTVAEFQARSPLGRLSYRFYRHPFIMLGLGPAYLFLLRHRLPIGMMRGGWQPWLSVMATNAAIALLVTAVVWLVGIRLFLIIHLPITLLAASIGVWLFYVQHQFEHTSWERDTDWSFHDAALHGSSYYDLPPILRWFTANIGVHHVHHLSSRIPYYRLSEVLADNPDLRHVGRITLLQSLRALKVVLWDEKERRLVSFREVPTCPLNPEVSVKHVQDSGK
jgi:omega-6 fatty acid desaturase (delta-12 desaturase)